MAFDINNFVIDRVKRGVMLSSSDDSLMYSINQIEDPTLTISADEKTAVDAMGTTIASFDTAKNAEFSASNSLFDLSLLATQMGTSKEVASSTSKITSPIFKTIEYADLTDGAIVLDPKPNDAGVKYIYALNGDSTLGTKYEASDSASATKFVYDSTTGKITIPTEVKSGQIFVMYEADLEQAAQVVGTATEFPKAGKFIMEVLGQDVCDPTKLVYAYLIFPNAKLDSNVEINLTTDGKHPFTLRANQAYCDSKKTLFKIVIPSLS